VKNVVVVGGLVGGASYVAYSFVGWVMEFSPRYWVYLGFLNGAAVAAMLGAASLYLWRNTTILPENVFRQAVRVLESNTLVRREIGKLTPSALKAYHLDHGFLGLDDNKRLRWFKPNIQMIFTVGAAHPPAAGAAAKPEASSWFSSKSKSNGGKGGADEPPPPVLAYVDAERTLSGLRLRNVSLLLRDSVHGFVHPHVIQVVGTDEDISARHHLRTKLISSKGDFLGAIPPASPSTPPEA
jgi:hypothetical protein